MALGDWDIEENESWVEHGLIRYERDKTTGKTYTYILDPGTRLFYAGLENRELKSMLLREQEKEETPKPEIAEKKPSFFSKVFSLLTDYKV